MTTKLNCKANLKQSQLTMLGERRRPSSTWDRMHLYDGRDYADSSDSKSRTEISSVSAVNKWLAMHSIWSAT